MTRVPELDALRGVAALLIMGHHYWHTVFYFGWISVDLFFVLSGYLITTIILRNAGAPGFLRSFYVRRSLRIWPIYYLTLLGVVALTFVHPGTGDLWGLPYFATFTQFIWQYWSNDSQVRYFPSLTHTWTLAVEEQFYLIWPALVLLFRKHVGPLAMVVLVASVAARYAGIPLNNLLTRSDGFAMGGLLAASLWGASPEQLPVRRKFFTALLLVSSSYLAWAVSTWGGGHLVWIPASPAFDLLWVNLCMLGIVGFVVTHSGLPMLALLRVEWLRKVGEISFGLYLYHFPIMFYLNLVEAKLGVGPIGHGAFYGINIALSFAVSLASWHWIEQPILRLKDRFDYRAPA